MINLHWTDPMSLKTNPICHHAATWNILNLKIANFSKTIKSLFCLKVQPHKVELNAPLYVLWHGYHGNTDSAMNPVSWESSNLHVYISLSDMHWNRLTFCPLLEAASYHCACQSFFFLWEEAISLHLLVSWYRCYLSPGCQHWTWQHAHPMRGKDIF